MCLCMGFVMSGYMYVWVCNEWVCVCMGLLMCGCVYVRGFVIF